MKQDVAKPQPRSPLPALLALALAYFTLGTASLSVVALARPISASLHVTAAQTGQLVTAFSLTFAVTALLAQSVAGHLQRKHLLLAGLTLLTLGLALGAAATSFTALLLTRMLAAIGASVLGPVASATGSLLVPPAEQPRALAIVFGGFTFASVLGVPFAALLSPALGWRGTLLVLAGLAVGAALLVWRLVPHVERGTRITVTTYLSTLQAPRVTPALLTTMLQIGSIFLPYAVIGAYLSARFASSPAWITGTLLAFGIGGVLGNAASGPLSRRLQPLGVLQLSLAASLLVAAALLFVPHVPVLGLLAFFIWSIFGNMFQAPQQARLIGLLPERRGLMLALNAAVLYFGIGLGSWAGSLLLPTLGAPLLALPPVLLLAGALLLTPRPRPVNAVKAPAAGA
ncbi:MFS transporter [Deinococcus sonorensis]|uniref:MFS transporter n=2 Tax=Deinococcus sonorensis TaxID=309891 RepID=A0AAU7U579_9DEIO